MVSLGIYLIASLFIIFGDSILTMDQDKLHQWIGSIVTGQSGWFHMYPYSKLDDSNCLDSCSPNIFALSWLSSAEGMFNSDVRNCDILFVLSAL